MKLILSSHLQKLADEEVANGGAEIRALSPFEFLRLISQEDNVGALCAEADSPVFDINRWERADHFPSLEVDANTGLVFGFEGRHRAALAHVAGIESMPVVVVAQDYQLVQQHIDGDLPLDEVFAALESVIYTVPSVLYPMPTGE